jgi:Mrp family chromosome partitioning ATPase
LWGQLGERYRFVLLDAGPFQAGLRAAAACDACLLVVELGTTTRVQAERAIARLEAAGARLLGSVVVGGG